MASRYFAYSPFNGPLSVPILFGMSPEPLKRIVYVSTALTDFSHDELVDLTSKSAERNRREGITGVLCYLGGEFLQVFEGPPERVDDLWERLNRDGRHTCLQVLVESPAAERLFEAWGMGLCDLESTASAARSEFRAVARFLQHAELKEDAVTAGLIRHFQALSGREADAA